MIGAGQAGLRQHSARQFAKSALHPVADDGVTDLLGYREAEANGRIGIAAPANQQDEAGRGRTKPAVRSEKLRAAGQLAD